MNLVTGAAGVSGSITVQEFAQSNIPVRALVRNRLKASKLLALPSVEVVEGDMLRPETLGQALEGVERVFMISSSNSAMVETQCTFIDACKRAGVRHIVKLSGAEPNFDSSKFLFTRFHSEIEHYLERSGLAWTHLRPSQFMQFYLREAQTIANKGFFALPLEDIELVPIDVRDIAKVACAILLNGGHELRSYEMTGPEPLTMVQVAQQISEAIGRAIRYVPVTIEERRTVLLASGMPPYFADALDEQARERLRHPKSRVSTGVLEEFGITPTRFSDFLKRHADAFRGEPY
jgi:uncharacterized protein YbjT (DUF2867 family)